MRRSSSPSCSAALLALAAACATPAAPPRPGFAISHDNSRAERWPFGLNAITTKFVVEPTEAGAKVASYWVVRTQSGAAFPVGELVADVRVRAEFPDTSFAPRAGVDFELVLGTDRNGAVTRETEPGKLEVRMPAAPDARQRGFAIRARFLGNGQPHDPPKSLLVELAAVRDERGRLLVLGEPRIARWLIVESSTAAEIPASTRARRIAAPDVDAAVRPE